MGLVGNDGYAAASQNALGGSHDSSSEKQKHTDTNSKGIQGILRVIQGSVLTKTPI